MDSRLLQTKLLTDIRRGALKKDKDLPYVLAIAELWPDKNALKKSIFNETHVDSEVKLEFLDVVGVHTYTEKVASEFFNALAATDNL